ncbi:MAG: S-adenosylmethionine hydrolase, partial [Porticoccaceae bacterium]
KITGSVIYIDNYGNVITNISQKLFNEIRQGREFELMAGRYPFNKIHEKYSDIVNFSIPKDERRYDGNRLAIFNSAGFIEISIYRSNLNTVGGASSLLNLNYRDQLTITFKDADTNR